ncbi:thiamine-binding protein [Tsukamurella sp. 1534]|uniref:thiamine-binding protein n=1 Tax=Tsukamurella sp. 1534 TaxID=1151061 RepID=UPI0002F1F920|nr:thiamine-binding protein [Tsukamurella sp. 1534]
MRLTAEFTSEPFHGEGEVPTHAVHAVEAVRAAGVAHDFGPLGTSVDGDAAAVLDALREALAAAFENGATRITIQIDRSDD